MNKNKFKLKKTVRDRFKVTATGKLLRRKMGQRHLKSVKRKTTLRRGKEPISVTGPLYVKVKHLLGI